MNDKNNLGVKVDRHKRVESSYVLHSSCDCKVTADLMIEIRD